MRRSFGLAIALVVGAFGCALDSATLLDGTPKKSHPGKGDAEASAASGGEKAAPAAASQGASSTPAKTTDLFHKEFGDPKDRPVVLVHGVQASFLFEATFAADLAKRGNYVVIYDQRSAGRSPPADKSEFTFARWTQDLEDLIHTLNLEDPILVGHSWGGTVTVKFLELHPKVARGAVIVGSPLNYADSMNTILERCTAINEGRWIFGDADKGRELQAKMFPHGVVPPFTFTADDAMAAVDYGKTCMLGFMDAPNVGSMATFARLFVKEHEQLLQTTEITKNFHDNEKLFYTDLGPQFQNAARGKFFAIYGDKEGLLSEAQVERIASLVSPTRFTLMRDAGHLGFIEQPEVFLNVLSADLDKISAP